MKRTIRKTVAVLLVMLMLVSVAGVSAFAKSAGAAKGKDYKTYKPYVRFGDGMLWRVMQVQEHQALLLSCSGSVFATVTDLAEPFTEDEEAAIIMFEYPRLTIDLDRYAFTQGSGTPEDPYQ